MSNTIDVCQTGYDYEQFQLNELESENMKLREKLDIALDTLGQIAKFSRNSTDAVQCAVAIQQINEMNEV